MPYVLTASGKFNKYLKLEFQQKYANMLNSSMKVPNFYVTICLAVSYLSSRTLSCAEKIISSLSHTNRLHKMIRGKRGNINKQQLKFWELEIYIEYV